MAALFKLFKKRYHLDMGKFEFASRVCEEWSRLGDGIVSRNSEYTGIQAYEAWTSLEEREGVFISICFLPPARWPSMTVSSRIYQDPSRLPTVGHHGWWMAISRGKSKCLKITSHVPQVMIKNSWMDHGNPGMVALPSNGRSNECKRHSKCCYKAAELHRSHLGLVQFEKAPAEPNKDWADLVRIKDEFEENRRSRSQSLHRARHHQAGQCSSWSRGLLGQRTIHEASHQHRCPCLFLPSSPP